MSARESSFVAAQDTMSEESYSLQLAQMNAAIVTQVGLGSDFLREQIYGAIFF